MKENKTTKKKVSEKKAEEYFNKKTKDVKDADLEKVIKSEKKLANKFSTVKVLTKYVDQFKLLIAIIKDYKNGKYKDIPWYSIAAIGVALLYILLPVDLIPDFIPFVGYIDDITVLLICLKMVQSDIEKYEVWKSKQKS